MINYTHKLVVAKFMIIVHDYYYAIHRQRGKERNCVSTLLNPQF